MNDFFNFYPHLKWQRYLLQDVLNDWDYSKGTHIGVCSGSLGSGKSIIASHIAVHHCIEHRAANILIGRKALPDLKDTLFKEILAQLDCDYLEEGVDYFVNETRAQVRFKNNSQITGRSWSDRKYKKLGSLNLSGAIVEEAAENDDEDKEAIDYIKMRVGRLPNVPTRFVLLLTNPDAPSHWIYKDYISSKSELVHVYYSNLRDNPFLDEQYELSVREGMDPKLAERMLDGKWVEIKGETVYHQYDPARNYVDDEYQVVSSSPIYMCWDFNIGEGKPLSACFFQVRAGIIHVFNEVVIDGMRTEQALDEMASQGLLNYPCLYKICGDATGKAKDTRSNLSDYGIIKKFLSNFKNSRGRFIDYEMCVPASNPPIRKRHNLVNAYCLNANGRVRILVYKSAKTVDEGLRLTQLRKTGYYQEDDTKYYQHVTTALGYGINHYDKSQQSFSPTTYSR